MNILKLIQNGSKSLKIKNIQSHVLDSELIASFVLNCSREDIIANNQKNVNFEKISFFNKLIKRRQKYEPISYILNRREFWSKDFEIDKGTLIPRPETEMMVDGIIKFFKKKRISFLDVGTGSACIIVSILSENINSFGVGIDISNKAIKVAEKNILKFNLQNRSKLFNRSYENFYGYKFDLVVSNPPYIKSMDIKNLSKDIRNYEPKLALDGGKDGLDVIKKVIYKSRSTLKKNGVLAIEIGNGQHKKVSRLLKLLGYKIKLNIKDYRNNVRSILSVLK